MGRTMNKYKLMVVVKRWIEQAPGDADFGVVDDIESSDTVLQLFY